MISINCRLFVDKKPEQKFSKFSTYFPFWIKSMVNKLPNHLYILCPMYDGDFQVGITGAKKNGETSKQALYRELGEEVGIIPQCTNLNENTLIIYNKHITTYSIKINDTLPVSKENHNKIINTNQDQYNTKIGCVVYGTEKELYELLLKKEIYKFYDTDNIIGICYISVADCKKNYLF